MSRTTRTRRLHRPSWPAAPGWLTRPLAHRGLHEPDGPVENSLEAFAAARDAGYGVELDVRMSVDGVPVVHHDAHLPDGRELAALPSGALPVHVPTLAAALDVLRRVPVMVEVKQEGLRPGALARVTADVLDRHLGLRAGTCCIASFHPGTLLWFARHRPAVPRVLAVTDQPDAPVGPRLRGRLASLEHLGLLRPHAVSHDVRGLPTPATTRWREDGGLMTTWTVHDARTLATARAHADGMIFEGLRP
jgi:glycerophosphoryl diester phosphodiesterase